MYPYGSCTVYTICLTYDNRISQCTSALLPDTQAICTITVESHNTILIVTYITIIENRD